MNLTRRRFKFEVRHKPNPSFQRTLTRGGSGPLNSDR
jgi:hypothetical protein